MNVGDTTYARGRPSGKYAVLATRFHLHTSSTI